MTRQLQDAYIVAATRTPVAKARGAFRNTRPDDLLAHVLRAVVAQAPGIDPERIADVIVGCAMPEGEQGMNVARIGVLLAGLPDTVAAQTINRFCSSGRDRSMPGASATVSRSTCASRSSGRVLRKTPRGALPTGVRVAATM